MAINFPSTSGQATDGSYTYTVAGITYAWDGTSWEAAGAGATATDRSIFSVTNAAAGSSSLSYNSGNGVFTYTPPDLSSYLTSYSETDTLQSVTVRGGNTNQEIAINIGSATALTVGDGSFQKFGVNTTLGEVSVGNASSTASSGLKIYHNTAGNTLRVHLDGATGTGTFKGNLVADGTLTAGGLTYPNTVGTVSQVLTSDGNGNVVWQNPTGLQSRTTVQGSYALSSGGIANPSIVTPKTYALLSIQTSHEAWVTLYSSTTARTNDASRSETTDPTPGSGVLAEVITSGAQTQLITPGTICFNDSGSNVTYAKVVNKSSLTTNVVVTLTYVQLEA